MSKIFNGIYNIFNYLFGVEPDSFMPMRNNILPHFIISLVVTIFVMEIIVIILIQTFFNKIENKLSFKIIPITQLVFIIHSGFLMTSFPAMVLLLIKPFIYILYIILYNILIAYGFFTTFINMIVKYFTDKTINF
tara:strand:- start:575 stop:979 length:405 start_codon:yes stop_codon:yes gene_type:complete